MRKWTRLAIEQDLVGEASQILGTMDTTQTVHAALTEVVARARRKTLATREFSDLTPHTIEEMRRSRGCSAH